MVDGRGMTRREFVKAAAAGAAVGALGLPAGVDAAAAAGKRPNIILIYTDQQRWDMMSCAGNPWLKTPGMDYIAAHGIRFTKAYTTNPVCVPARVSMMTGRFPGSFKDPQGRVTRYNQSCLKIADVPATVKDTTLAGHLKGAGYDIAYGGKVHLPEPLTPAELGFTIISEDQREPLNKAAADYIAGPHEKPYFLWLNPINPHDICYMAVNGLTVKNRNDHNGRRPVYKTLLKAMEYPAGVSENEFFEKYCPPVPENYEPANGEPAAVKALLTERQFKIDARNNYTDRDWRLHRWAYCRLTELVDKHVQAVLEAVQRSGQEENTLIIFTSDHGDMDASHRMEHKTVLYEESTHIPFLAMYKGQIPAGTVDERHLVSTGLDTLPTVCDYAGAAGGADPRGQSLRPLFEQQPAAWRETLGVESQIGRMVVNADGLKYIRYDFVPGKVEEQLLDLKADAHEMRHFTDEPAYQAKLADLRKAFAEWFPEAAAPSA